jgi:hypothetical protein
MRPFVRKPWARSQVNVQFNSFSSSPRCCNGCTVSRHRRYGAHLVFGLYAHSFLLLIFVIEAKLPLALATIFSMWAIVYYAFALKRVYGGTWIGTIGRGALLATLYCLTIFVLGVLVTAVVLSI